MFCDFCSSGMLGSCSLAAALVAHGDGGVARREPDLVAQSGSGGVPGEPPSHHVHRAAGEHVVDGRVAGTVLQDAVAGLHFMVAGIQEIADALREKRLGRVHGTLAEYPHEARIRLSELAIVVLGVGQSLLVGAKGRECVLGLLHHATWSSSSIRSASRVTAGTGTFPAAPAPCRPTPCRPCSPR